MIYNKLSKSFYLQTDVVTIARELLGKFLMSNIDGVLCGGIITETEAYAGVTDRASHAYGGRRSNRTEVMYREGGVAYIYFCYGVHSLFNIVTNKKDIPHAVLIRAIEPVIGIDEMFKRLGRQKMQKDMTTGPGKLSKAMGFYYKDSGISLNGDKIWLEERGIKVEDHDIQTTTRIGVDYAGEDAKLPYRFLLNIKII